MRVAWKDVVISVAALCCAFAACDASYAQQPPEANRDLRLTPGQWRCISMRMDEIQRRVEESGWLLFDLPCRSTAAPHSDTLAVSSAVGPSSGTTTLGTPPPPPPPPTPWHHDPYARVSRDETRRLLLSVVRLGLTEQVLLDRAVVQCLRPQLARLMAEPGEVAVLLRTSCTAPR